MPSEEIVDQIIRAVVSLSEEKLKQEQDAQIALAGDDIENGAINSDIIRAHRNTQVSETLAAFIIRSVALNPEHNFDIEADLSTAEVERLIKILNQALNAKIVSFLLIQSNIGSPTDVRVIREASAALDSVLPASELPSFMSLSKTEKEAQLNNLAGLVTGIRLYNKHLDKGGETIENVPEHCYTQLEELMDILDEETIQTETKIQKFKAIIDSSTLDAVISEIELKNITKGLAFNRQYLVYLDAIRQQAIAFNEFLLQFNDKYDMIMNDLVQSCKSKAAVPIDSVYPLFTQLSTIWATLFDLIFRISYQRGILDSLVSHSKSLQITVPPSLEESCQKYLADIEPEIQPDEEIIKNASKAMAALTMVDRKVQVLHPGNTTQYYQLPVQYDGFCPLSLIKKDGLIVPGNKNCGIYKYRDKIFVFSDIEKALEFFKAGDENIKKIIEYARHHPAYVQLLHLYKEPPFVDSLNSNQKARKKLLSKGPLVSDAGSQVDTHILESFIDKNYFWNEWELRRRALKLVSLKTKLTHSSQTVISQYRQDSETQHYEPKPTATQTRKSSGTNVPRTVHYLSGLRNDTRRVNKDMYLIKPKQYHFKIVDLSIDVDGTPVPYPKIQ